MKGVKATERLQELRAGQMCNYEVKLTDPNEVDAEWMGWIRTAYETAGQLSRRASARSST